MRDRMANMVREVQDQICAAMASVDGADFKENTWERPGGGGGRSRLLQDSVVLEKAGVNTSVVHGELPQAAAKAMSARIDLEVPEGCPFYATGVSLVIHPRNPFAPTAHANYRYFELDGGRAWWFGGGADLTPSYLIEDDAKHFHGTLKAACDRHDATYYPRFKAWCDRYFVNQHRGESRGLGGIFFDDLNDRDPEEIFAFVSDAASHFVEGYQPILERRADTPYTQRHRDWQLHRRGRYVEFNLVWDRGTHFGLRTDARVESVLMSLPLHARWETGLEVEPGSPEAELEAVLREPREWV